MTRQTTLFGDSEDALFEEDQEPDWAFDQFGPTSEMAAKRPGVDTQVDVNGSRDERELQGTGLAPSDLDRNDHINQPTWQEDNQQLQELEEVAPRQKDDRRSIHPLPTDIGRTPTGQFDRPDRDPGVSPESIARDTQTGRFELDPFDITSGGTGESVELFDEDKR